MTKAHKYTAFRLLWTLALIFAVTCSAVGISAEVSLNRPQSDRALDAAHLSLPTYLWVTLHGVKERLPDTMPIHGGPTMQLAYRRHFGVYRSLRTRINTARTSLGEKSGKEILAMLRPGIRYTFVITANEWIVAEVEKQHGRKFYGKHYVVADYAERLHFAGECWRGENDSLVIDNNSGSYRPPAHLLFNAADLLVHNLGVQIYYKEYNAG